jgi:hypothetical protein
MRILAGPVGGRLFGSGEPVARPVRSKTLRQRARAFIAAVAGPPASDEQYHVRMTTCQSNTCGHLKPDAGKLYCGACGCPHWKLAELTVKLRFADLECPCEPPFWGREF